MLNMLHLTPWIYQIAGLRCSCLRNVDLAKSFSFFLKPGGGETPCVGKKTNCRQGSWRLHSEAALNIWLLEEQRQKVGLLTLVWGRHRRADVQRRWNKCSPPSLLWGLFLVGLVYWFRPGSRWAQVRLSEFELGRTWSPSLQWSTTTMSWVRPRRIKYARYCQVCHCVRWNFSSVRHRSCAWEIYRFYF